MKLESCEDDEHNKCYCVLRSPGKFILMGIYVVFYGYRIRGWFAGRSTCVIDWCAGDKQENVERLYSILAHILEGRDEDFECFRAVPLCSTIKPFYNDPAFMEKIAELTKDGDFVLRKLPPVEEMRRKAVESYANQN